MGFKINATNGLLDIVNDLSSYVTITSGDARYLKLDSSNDPLTGSLEIRTGYPELTFTGEWDGGASINFVDDVDGSKMRMGKGIVIGNSLFEVVNSAAGGGVRFYIDVNGDVYIALNTFIGGNTDIDGDLIVDTDTLFVNSATDRVGIGHLLPQSHLDIQGPAGVGAASAAILTLDTAELTVVDGDELGRINFNAPLESSGSDAILAGGAIWAEADATFTSTVNNTELCFGTATTSAAVERMRIDSGGQIGVGTSTPANDFELMLPTGSSVIDRGLQLTRSGNTGYLRLTTRSTSTSDFLPAIIGKSTNTGSGFLFRGLRPDGAADTVGTFILQAANSANDGAVEADQCAIRFRNWSTDLLTVQGDGKVGIGTTTPANDFCVELPTGSNVIDRGIELTRAGTDDGYLRLTTRSTSTTNFLPAIIGKSTNTSSGFLVRGLRPAGAADTIGTFIFQTANPTNDGPIDDNQCAIKFRNWATDICTFKGNGNFGVAVDDPTAQFHIAAGTATAATAPLKFNAGTVLTTPETGAMEYNGTHLYFTIGGTRYQIDQQTTGAVTSVFTRTGAVVANTNDYTWAQINKATSSIADITTKSHTALTDKGTTTHADIDSHIGDTSIHTEDNLLVHLAGDESITDLKTFSELPECSVSATSANQLVNKAYADSLKLSTPARLACRVATTAALAACTYDNGADGVGATLTGDADGALAAIDSVVVIAGQRVLIKNQADAIQNGIYDVTQKGDVSNPFILTRSTDFDEVDNSEVVNGAFTPITAGTVNGNTQQMLVTTDDPIAIGTSDLVFTKLSAATAYTGSLGVKLSTYDFQLDFVSNDGLELSTNSVTIAYDNSSIGIVSNHLAVLSTGITNAMLAGSIDDTKLSQITTASKVSAASITSMTSLPSAAGVVPTVNLGSGTANNTTYLRGDQTWSTPATGSVPAYSSFVRAESEFCVASLFKEGIWYWDFINEGSNAEVGTVSANHLGIMSLSSTTTENSGFTMKTDTTAFLIGGTESSDFVFYLPETPSTTGTIRLGFQDSFTSTAPTDGIWLNIAGTTLDGRTAAASSSSTTGTSYTLTGNTWYRAKFVVNAAATRVDFYVYTAAGSGVWTNYLTTNIPTASTGHGVVATDSGTTAVTLLNIDYMNLLISRTLTR